jgi:hypothetical protein
LPHIIHSVAASTEEDATSPELFLVMPHQMRSTRVLVRIRRQVEAGALDPATDGNRVQLIAVDLPDMELLEDRLRC